MARVRTTVRTTVEPSPGTKKTGRRPASVTTVTAPTKTAVPPRTAAAMAGRLSVRVRQPLSATSAPANSRRAPKSALRLKMVMAVLAEPGVNGRGAVTSTPSPTASIPPPSRRVLTVPACRNVMSDMYAMESGTRPTKTRYVRRMRSVGTVGGTANASPCAAMTATTAM